MSEIEIPHVLVTTCNRYDWLMWPFANLFNIFFDQSWPVTYGCYRKLSKVLPLNFTQLILNDAEFPSEKWSDGLLRALDTIPSEQVLIMMDDYMLYRHVDIRAVLSFSEYMHEHPDVLRFDLTTDRLNAYGDARNSKHFMHLGWYDVVTTPSATPYQMSLQAALWNKALLKRIVKKGLSPWELEVHTTVPDDMIVLGSWQVPMRYSNIYYQGKVKESEIEKIPDEFRHYVYEALPPEEKNDKPNP